MSNINKTILILTAQFGAGHVSAANAIKEYILEKNPNYNVVIQNFIDASIPRINNPMVKMYERNTKYVPELYNYYYYAKKNFNSKFDITYKIYTPKLTEYILEIKPDLIISTFPSAAGCVHDFNSKRKYTYSMYNCYNRCCRQFRVDIPKYRYVFCSYIWN